MALALRGIFLDYGPHNFSLTILRGNEPFGIG
jgi:hypothetical protein